MTLLTLTLIVHLLLSVCFCTEDFDMFDKKCSESDSGEPEPRPHDVYVRGMYRLSTVAWGKVTGLPSTDVVHDARHGDIVLWPITSASKLIK